MFHLSIRSKLHEVRYLYPTDAIKLSTTYDSARNHYHNSYYINIYIYMGVCVCIVYIYIWSVSYIKCIKITMQRYMAHIAGESLQLHRSMAYKKLFFCHYDYPRSFPRPRVAFVSCQIDGFYFPGKWEISFLF